MLQEIITGTILYWSTAMDLILISVVMIASHPIAGKKQQIILGSIMGAIFLIIISLFLALGLRLIPDKWLLGLLGFIPLVFGFIALFRGPEDLDDINKGNDTTSSRKIMWTMFILAITSCAPDNIGLFTPYFANLQTTFIPVVTIVFLINVLFMGLFTDFVSRVTSLQNFLFKYSGILVAVTYIVLGLMIIIESDTLQHIGKFIFR